VPRQDEALGAFVGRFTGELKQRQGVVLMVMAYGSVAAYDAVMEQLRRELGEIDWPVLWVEGASCFGAPLAGFQVFILPEGKVERVRLGGQVVGTVFSDAGARHCLLAGLGPTEVSRSRAEQGEQFFNNVAAALGQAGFTYGDIARTWFYNDEILAWYDDFNRVRTAFYETQKFKSGSLPASTAVLGRNPRGAALTFGAWAVVPASTDVVVREIASPLQCPAPAYGSSFSRAMEISSGGRKRLLVSGTASIEPGGKTVWQGDAVKQIELTMDVVEAMLRPNGLGFGDVTRATAYFKHAADQKIFESWLDARGLAAMPVVPVHCDICRDDLLFEIELDACRSV
jgi:enamine deaminase RidA (YjgF/YER057c/UK114 family)